MTVAILIALAIGLSVAFQPVTNAAAAKEVGIGPIMVVASLLVFVASCAYAWATAEQNNWDGLTRLRPDMLLGGALYGLTIIYGGLFVFPRLGAGMAAAIIIGTQILGALTIDHFGLYDMPVSRVNPTRILGVVLLLAGVWFLRPAR